MVAKQEQLNILQPLIHDDQKLQATMNLNHSFARSTNGFLSPQYEVVYSFEPHADNPDLKTTFDSATGVWDRMTGSKQSLPNAQDRMKYVGDIARDFNDLMTRSRGYMEGELAKIRGWLDA